MSLSQSAVALLLCQPGLGSVYVRDDGARAHVVGIARGFVFFRRTEDGELMRVRRDAFARRYRLEVAS